MLDSTVVFNEIMYNPIEEGEQQLEWIELYNQLAVDMDISEWVLDGGVNYTFPDQTIVPGRGHLIVAADPEAVGQLDSFPSALGPWEGRLNNNGEELRLYNNDNRLMNSVDFGDNGDWPVGPDGGGVSLVKQDQFSASHLAENWTFSSRVGGTPGIDNFIKPGTFIFEDIMGEGAPARAIVPTDASLGTDWIQPGFDDSGWLQGTTGVGHESSRSGSYDRFLGLDLDDPPNGQDAQAFEDTNGSVYMRFPFNLPEGKNYDSLNLRMRYDDGFIAYINGVEVARDRAPDDATWNSVASSSHRDSDAITFVDFNLNEHFDLLKPGENVLAIHGMNQSVTGNDSLFYPVIQAGNEIFPPEVIDVSFNEVAAAGDENFFVEIMNHDDTAIDLSRLKLINQGDEDQKTFNLPAQELAPGEMLSFSAAALGFQSANNDFLALYTVDDSQLVDARRVTNSLRGMEDGMWQYPSVATPGTANSVDISSDVVINEIMYHASPNLGRPDTPPTFSKEIIHPISGVWNYNATGADLGLDWENQTYTSGQDGWASGPALIGYETSSIPEEIRTELTRPSLNDPRFLTYYFQTEITVTQEMMDKADAFQFRHLIDDGALFYVNGQEIHRFNMVDGDITADMDSDRTTRNAEYSEPIDIDKNLFNVGSNIISAEVHISSGSSSDIVFGAEIFYGEQLTPFIPGIDFSQSDEEWIELFNKGDQQVDLTGWKIRDGVSFDFPEGTKIDAGGYLLVANNAESLQAKYPELTIAGQFNGALGNRDDNIQLFDANKNLADEVHYYEGGRWDAFADGGGSSLELSDPNADNSKAEVWAASYEGDKSEWLDYSFRGTSLEDIAGGRARFNEFIFGLLDTGQFLIDDVQVLENGNRQLIQNGTFENDNIGDEPDKWRLIGNHVGTVIVDPTDPNNKVLHVDATGAQAHVHDHAETTFIDNRDIRDGTEYELKFRAKWLAGNSQLNSRLYFSRLSNTAFLDVPDKTGTPGAQNSNFVANTGPVYDNLQQTPATPLENQPVDISVQIEDMDGVQGVKLWYHVDRQDWASVDMTADGNIYSGQIKGHESGDVIQFYVEATDTSGLTTQYPDGGPDSRALYQVEDGTNPRSNVDRMRIVMLDADRRELFSNQDRMSNRVLPASLVHNDRIFHNIGVRQTGSRWIRPNSGYKVFMNTEEAFYGVHDTIRFDLNGMAEIVMKQMVNRAGIGQNSMYDDIAYLVSPNRSHSHEILLNLARYENIYLDEQFGDSSGTKFELDDVTFPTSPSGGIEGEKTGTDVNTGRDIGGNASLVRSQGSNPEFYRSHILIKSQRAQDDFGSIVRMAQGIHVNERDGLFETSNEVMDVDLWMRHYANQAYLGNWDTYGFRRPKNLRMYVRPSDDKVIPLFWDCDLCNFTEPIFNRSEGTSRLDEIRNIPHNLRLFWGHMHHYMEKSFNEEYVAYWAAHYGEKAANQTHGGDENFNGITASTRNRTRSVTDSLNDAIPPVDFSITTNDGNAMDVDTDTVTLEGKGWVNVREIYLEGVASPLDVFWPESDAWQLTVPVANGMNNIKLNAVDFDGNPISSAEINVTSTAANAVSSALKVTEVHYNPADASAEEAAQGFTDNDEFEFIELQNISDEAISLENVSFQKVDIDNDDEGIDFDLGTGKITELQAGERMVIVENMDAFTARYGEGIPVSGQWSGQLGNGAETLTLFVNDVAVQQFRYEDAWYPSTDGEGASLEIVDPSVDIAAYSTMEAWRASAIPGGSPGADSLIPGDANGDGIFNSTDLVLVSQAGEYEDGIDGNSTFAEGDWNGDGDFDSRDIVLAFIYGAYTAAATSDAPLSSDDVRQDEAAQPVVDRADAQVAVIEEQRQKELVAASIDQMFDEYDESEVLEDDEPFEV